jgi:hypothetical protein
MRRRDTSRIAVPFKIDVLSVKQSSGGSMRTDPYPASTGRHSRKQLCVV